MHGKFEKNERTTVHVCERMSLHEQFITLARYAMARLPTPTPVAAALAPTAFPLAVTRILALGPRALVVVRRFYMNTG